MNTGKESLPLIGNEEGISDVGKKMLEKLGDSCLTAQYGGSAMEIHEKGIRCESKSPG